MTVKDWWNFTPADKQNAVYLLIIQQSFQLIFSIWG